MQKVDITIQEMCKVSIIIMLLSPLALKALNSIEEIESRILIANVNGNHIITTIISCYSPTNVSDCEDVEQVLPH